MEHPQIRRSHSTFGPLLLNPHSKDPSKYRWSVLILSGLLLFGNYYAFDLPAALNRPLMTYLNLEYKDWQITLNLMYSLYSLPNMFLPAIGGYVIDTHDPRKVLVVLSIVVCVGQTLVAIGTYLKDVRVMVVGRLVFGIGGECIGVSEAAIVTSFFTGRELAFALGMNLSVARLGSVANSIISPRLATYFGSPLVAVWVGTFTCYASLVAAIVLVGVMTVCEKDEETQEGVPILKSSTFDNVVRLPTSFWLLCVLCILLYGTVIPFNATASDFLTSKWYPGDIEMAGLVMRFRIN